jgi:hypothetical protein
MVTSKKFILGLFAVLPERDANPKKMRNMSGKYREKP